MRFVFCSLFNDVPAKWSAQWGQWFSNMLLGHRKLCPWQSVTWHCCFQSEPEPEEFVKCWTCKLLSKDLPSAKSDTSQAAVMELFLKISNLNGLFKLSWILTLQNGLSSSFFVKRLTSWHLHFQRLQFGFDLCPRPLFKWRALNYWNCRREAFYILFRRVFDWTCIRF